MPSPTVMTWIAWDIETCPLPPEDLAESHQDRLQMEMDYRRDKEPDLTEEDLRRKASSLHPMTGWICAIAAVRGRPGEGHGEPYGLVASSPEEEADLLSQFWQDMGAIGRTCSGVRWVTCNGKRFDVPFLSARTIRHGIGPAAKSILDTYPYNHEPHLDLATLWQHTYYGLEDLCAHLGVASPKAEGFDGSDVAGAVERGEIDRVRRYCERDAVATFRCAQEVTDLL